MASNPFMSMFQRASERVSYCDSLAQQSEHYILQAEKKKNKENHTDVSVPKQSFLDYWDVSRTAQCAGYGAFVTGPIIATWYPFLDKLSGHFNMTAKYGLWGGPLFKVFVDEFIMDPPTLVLFFGYMNVCEGGSWDTFLSKLNTQLIPTFLTGLAIWPPVLLGVFRFLPLHAQAPVINACCIIWDGFVSHRNFLSKHPHIEASLGTSATPTTSVDTNGAPDESNNAATSKNR
eukprot:Nitzschia sp. Nitz4//scaffold93_size78505//41209//41964//NITZ4_005422-RA/size78505-snap-gene-0.5-mRNA-1//-1//CDS//3329560294//4876//frame0